jgi:hypothetical protein
LEASGEGEFMLLLTEHDLIIRLALVAARGREVKHTGDGVMASFGDASRALGCAIAIQDGFDARNAAGDRPELRVRIGLAAGEPVQHNNDLFGSAVTSPAGSAMRPTPAAFSYQIRCTGSALRVGSRLPAPMSGVAQRILGPDPAFRTASFEGFIPSLPGCRPNYRRPLR